jgi:hypothetical protein
MSPSHSRVFSVVLAIVGFLALLVQPAAAQPIPTDPASVPGHLRQYVVDTVEWQQSPWMTSPTCRDRGGDFSSYAGHLIHDLPELLEHFQPTFAGVGGNAAARKDFLVREFRAIANRVAVPGGYCVDQLAKWAPPNPAFKPFGFEWGNLTWWDDQTHGVRPYGCTATSSQTPADALGPCRGFYVECVGIVTQQDHAGCEAWNAFSDEFVRQMNKAIHTAYKKYGIDVECHDCVITEVMGPGEIAQTFLDWVAKKGMEQVVAFVVAGVTKLWSAFTEIAVEHSRPNLTGIAFTTVYNLIAGIALALGFLGWLITLATSWRRGHLQFTLFGGIKAVLGVTLAAVGAVLMLQLADDATMSLVVVGGDIAGQADFTGSLAKVNPLVAVLAGILIAICLVFSIVFLVLHGPLVLMWTLFGSVAAAGQVHPASAGWLLKWAARLTALAWAKFAMVGVMLLAQALLLPLDAGEDPIRQVIDVIQGLTLAALIVTSPYLLMELVDFVSDRIGGAQAAGGPAATAAGNAARSTGRDIRSAGRVIGGAAGGAARTMMAAGAEVTRTLANAASTKSSGTGGPPPTPSAQTRPGGRSSPNRLSPRPASTGLANTAPPRPANRGRVVSSSPQRGPTGNHNRPTRPPEP